MADIIPFPTRPRSIALSVDGNVAIAFIRWIMQHPGAASIPRETIQDAARLLVIVERKEP